MAKVTTFMGAVRDIELDSRTHKARAMAQCGFHAAYIASHCHLTIGQVHYRTRKDGIFLRAYRDGQSPMIVKVLKVVVAPAYVARVAQAEKGGK